MSEDNKMDFFDEAAGVLIETTEPVDMKERRERITAYKQGSPKPEESKELEYADN